MQAAEVEIPALTKGKILLTAMEMESVRNLAHLRIHDAVLGTSLAYPNMKTL